MPKLPERKVVPNVKAPIPRKPTGKLGVSTAHGAFWGEKVAELTDRDRAIIVLRVMKHSFMLHVVNGWRETAKTAYPIAEIGRLEEYVEDLMKEINDGKA